MKGKALMRDIVLKNIKISQVINNYKCLKLFSELTQIKSLENNQFIILSL